MPQRQEPRYDACPKEKMIDDLYEKVVTGNGRDALMVRADALETQVELLTKIVQGDGEKTGLQPQMIAMNANMRLMNWLLATLIGVLLILATVFGPKISKLVDARQPSQTTEIYASR